MAKALAEQKSVVATQTSEVPWKIEPVLEEGKVKHIHFDGDPDAPRRAAPAAPPPRGAAAPILEFRETYHSRHPEPIAAIESEVDHLARATPGRSDAPTLRRTLYETPGGEVREAILPTSGGPKRLLYLTRVEDGREVERRFSPAAVDRLVSPPAPPAPALPEAAPAAAPAPPEKPKRGLFGFLRRGKKGEEQDYIPIVPGIPDPAPLPAAPPPAPLPLPLREEPAWTPPAAAPALRSVRPKPARRKPRRRKAPKPRRLPATARKARKARKPRPPAPYRDYKGDLHLVIELEGIGPTYAKRLQAAGVHTTDRLCYEKAARLAKRVKAPTKTVKTWQSMAELVKVKGIGPQYAEALARAGVDGIDGLKAAGAKAIADRVTRYLDSLESHVLGTGVTAKRVASWQRRARPMRKVRQPAPPTTPPEATTWYEKARQEKAAREQRAGLRKAKRARRKARPKRRR